VSVEFSYVAPYASLRSVEPGSYVCGCVLRCSNQESVAEMRNWNLQFATNLLQIGARHLQPEMLFQNRDKVQGVTLSVFLVVYWGLTC